MSLLLDSNVLLWWVSGGSRLPAALVERLRREDPLFVSLVTPWELWIKANSGRLTLPTDFDARLAANSLSILAPAMEDARLAARLPLIHRDLFDRMIIAQALNRQATVITGDEIFTRYGVDVILV